MLDIYISSNIIAADWEIPSLPHWTHLNWRYCMDAILSSGSGNVNGTGKGGLDVPIKKWLYERDAWKDDAL